MEKPYRIELFGGLRILTAERVITRFQTQKTGALLAYLAYHLHRAHTREILIDMLWPGSEPQAARNSLSVSLSSLRHLLEPPGVPPGSVIVANRRDISLNPAAVVTDVAEFDKFLKGAADTSSAIRTRCLTQAAALYHASLLPGYYEDWIVPEQHLRAEQYFQAVRDLTTALVGAGNLPAAVETMRQAVLAEPLREEASRDLMRLLHALGRSADALRQYYELEKALKQELDVAPEPSTQRLAQQIETGIKNTGSTVTLPPPQARTEQAFLSPTPAGTVTFLVADLPTLNSSPPPVDRHRPGSAIRRTGKDEVSVPLSEQSHLLSRMVRRSGGHPVAGVGGCPTFVFARSTDALFCAVQSMRAIVQQDDAPVPPRLALHTGEIAAKEGNPRDLSLQLANATLQSAQSGQILCTEETACLLRRDLEPGLRLRDLGLYHLLERSSPERLFQILYPGMPSSALSPVLAQRGFQSGLPLQFTRFFGRESEIAHLTKRLEAGNLGSSSPSSCLITLTGPGGSGKTRLALEVAERTASSQQDAIWFVSLADLREASRLPDTVAEAMRMPRFPGSEPLELVVEALSRQRSLLLLDNFEHLVEEGAEFVRLLLERAAGLRCLVTSRRTLGLPGEVEFTISPLPLPKRSSVPEALLACDSVRLFVDRAQLVLPDFQLTPGNAGSVAKLCSMLEGIPLALELAAARAQALTPTQMLARVSQRFDFLVSHRRGVSSRQQTLRATQDWSYDLLPPELQSLFARLSVFRGGWTLDAAERIMGALCEESGIGARKTVSYGQGTVLCSNRDAGRSILDDLSQLRECSLIQAEEHNDEMRFRLLETLREYGADKLRERELAALRKHHASYFLAWAENANEGVTSAEQGLWLERFEAEHDNLRAALGWAAENDIESGLRLLKVVTNFWSLHSHQAEGRQWLNRILAQSGDALPELRIAPLKEAGTFALEQGDYEEARRLLEQSLALSLSCNDEAQTAAALNGLGTLALHQGDGDKSCTLHSESLSIMRRIEHRAGIATALMGLSQAACTRGDYTTARSLLEEAQILYSELSDRRRMAILLTNLGKIKRLQGDYDGATDCYNRALAIQRAIGDRAGASRILGNLGNLADDRGDPDLACTLHRESLEIQRELGDKQGMTISLYNLATVTQGLGDYAQAIAYHQQSLRLCLELHDRLGVAYSLEALSGMLLARKNAELATRLFGAAEALREQINSPVPPLQQPRHEAHRAALCQALGETLYAAARNAGRVLPWQQAVVCALAEKEC